MEHAQIRLNTDGTICLDMYTCDPFVDEFTDQFVSTCEIISHKTKSEIRSHPFHIGRCGKCGHWIITNRDSYEEFKCQNCQSMMLLADDHHRTSVQLTAAINQKRGAVIKRVTGQVAFMLLIFNIMPDIELLHCIFSHFGFSQCNREKNVKEFCFLLAAAIQNHFLDDLAQPSSFYSTELNRDDMEYNGLIPRVEECSRLIRRTFPGTYIVSNVVPIVSSHADPSSLEIHTKIKSLVQEGKLDEAYELLQQI